MELCKLECADKKYKAFEVDPIEDMNADAHISVLDKNSFSGDDLVSKLL